MIYTGGQDMYMCAYISHHTYMLLCGSEIDGKSIIINVLIWRCVYRASYCNVLMTNKMHNSYNQF